MQGLWLQQPQEQDGLQEILGAPLDALAKGTGTVASGAEVAGAARRFEFRAWKETSR